MLNKSWLASSLSFSRQIEQKSRRFSKRIVLSFLKKDSSIGTIRDPEKKREMKSEGENIVRIGRGRIKIWKEKRGEVKTNKGEKEAPRSTPVLSKARSVAGRPRLNRCRVDWGRA